MAAIAKRDQEKRTVEVDRVQLIETLKKNREQHVADYEEAMSGYKTILLSKIDEAFADAKKKIERRYKTTKKAVANLSDKDIASQRDYFTLVDEIGVEMKVPRSYSKEYDAAIDMATWDVRETLELTHAEFTCFVRDQWDWSTSFDAITSIYKG